MFLFGKKKEKKETAAPAASANREQLLADANAKAAELESLTGTDRVPVLNEVGSLFYQAGELEKAITYYEESLSLKREMGKAYTDLMALYNKMRQRAAEEKDDDKMNFYLKKVQDMMQRSKDMLRGKA